MRRSASEIINDLETRVATLEKSAIFGLFRKKEEPRPMSLREKNLKRRQREQDEREALERKERKDKQKRLKVKTKEAQKRYEKFMDELQYQLFTWVDDLDADIRRGDLSGVITMGQFEYKIISELDEVKDLQNIKVKAEITIVGPGLRKPLTVQPLIYGSKGMWEEGYVTDDASIHARRIWEALKKAMKIAHSDKAVTDRAEAKRMRKEKYRLANRRYDY
jgi:hypothetical protein